MYDDCFYCANDVAHPDAEEENFQRIRQNAVYLEERWRAQDLLSRANHQIEQFKRWGVYTYMLKHPAY